MSQKAIIIGAGLGGMAAASLLANEGYSVTVYEKNPAPGGKMQEFEKNGYRFDTGPSLFTMPFILEKLFSQCGKNLNEYLSFTELDPLCRYFYPDGVIFDNFSDKEKTQKEIRRFAPEDAEAYSKFLERSEELYNRTADAFLFNPLSGFSDLKSLNIFDFLDIDAFTTVSDKVDQYFKSNHLRQFFKRFTTYNGSSPYQAPATLNVIPHVELNQGGYYVKGGLYRIAQALHKLAEESGVEFIFNSQISSIEVKKSRASGVVFINGESTSAELIVANSDATDTILNLLPDDSISSRKKLKQASIEPSCSGFVMMLGCNKKWEQLKHHNIFFSGDYRGEFEDIFTAKKMPADPTIYIANTSYSDPDHAPDGSSNLFILVNAPYVTKHQDWVSLGKTYSAFLIKELEKRGITDLNNSIEISEVITPQYFMDRFGSNKGSIYGTSSNSKFSAFLRPRNRLKGIDNLYLVGGSTHPGGGIPLVIQSAFNAVELLKRS